MTGWGTSKKFLEQSHKNLDIDNVFTTVLIAIDHEITDRIVLTVNSHLKLNCYSNSRDIKIALITLQTVAC
jgi:hypothetical protein